MRVEVSRILAGAGRPRIKFSSASEHRLVTDYEADVASLLGLYVRCASRLLWNWARIETSRLEPLEAAVADVLPRKSLPRATTFSIEVRGKGSFGASPMQIRGAVRSAVERALGWHVHAENPDIWLVVRVLPDGVWVSADLAGNLTKRGYRPPRVEAPIRENLAAQMVALSGWYPQREALIDPFAGSGTLLIEADGWATTRPVPRRLASWLSPPAAPPLRPETVHRLLGIEEDPLIRPALERSLRAAGASPIPVVFGDLRSLSGSELRAKLDSPTGVVLANPPYGVRIGEDVELDEVYGELGRLWSELGAGWRLAMIGLPDRVERVFGTDVRMKKPMRNGDLPTYFYRFGEEPDFRPSAKS